MDLATYYAFNIMLKSLYVLLYLVLLPPHLVKVKAQ